MLTQKKRRAVACLLVGAFSAGFLSFAPTYSPARADTLTSLRQQYSDLQKQQQTLQQQINDLGTQVQAEQQKVSAISKNVTVLRQQITVLNRQIAAADAQLKSTNQSIAATQKRIAAEQEEYRGQVCTLYEAGPYYRMEMLLTSKNVSSFLTRLQILNNLSDHTNDVVQSLKADTAKLSLEKQQLQQALSDLQGSQGALAAKQTVLKSQLKEEKATVKTLQSKKASVKAVSQTVQEKAYETDAAINAEIEHEAAVRAAQLAAQRAAAEKAAEERQQQQGSSSGDSSNGGSGGGASGSGSGASSSGGGVSIPSGGVSSSYIVQYAEGFIGTPYVFGSASPSVGFDCSGFTQYVYANAAGIALTHSAAAQSGYGSAVSRGDLQPGDLVFFATSGGGVNHVGIYAGGGTFIEANSSYNPAHAVVAADLNSAYWSSRYVCARRLL